MFPIEYDIKWSVYASLYWVGLCYLMQSSVVVVSADVVAAAAAIFASSDYYLLRKEHKTIELSPAAL